MRKKTGWDAYRDGEPSQGASWKEKCEALTGTKKSPIDNTVALSDLPSRAETPGYLPNQPEISDTKVRKVTENLKSLDEKLAGKDPWKFLEVIRRLLGQVGIFD